jgi:hypothetical protein
MSDTTFSSVQVCEITGATYRQVDYLVRRGLFGGDATGRGSGTKRLWNVPQVITVRAFIAISNVTPIHYRRLGDAAHRIRVAWEHDNALRGTWLVVTGHEALVTNNPDRLYDAVEVLSVGAAVVVNLEVCAAHVREATEGLLVAS